MTSAIIFLIVIIGAWLIIRSLNSSSSTNKRISNNIDDNGQKLAQSIKDARESKRRNTGGYDSLGISVGMNIAPQSERIVSVDKKEIPNGYVVFEDSTHFVAGVTFRPENCTWWVSGDNLSLSFRRERNNPHDENAIAIYGKNDTGSKKIGYVKSEIADELVYGGLDKHIKPRLVSVKVGDAYFIEYEILVKETEYQKYLNNQ